MIYTYFACCQINHFSTCFVRGCQLFIYSVCLQFISTYGNMKLLGRMQKIEMFVCYLYTSSFQMFFSWSFCSNTFHCIFSWFQFSDEMNAFRNAKNIKDEVKKITLIMNNTHIDTFSCETFFFVYLFIITMFFFLIMHIEQRKYMISIERTMHTKQEQIEYFLINAPIQIQSVSKRTKMTNIKYGESNPLIFSLNEWKNEKYEYRNQFQILCVQCAQQHMFML